MAGTGASTNRILCIGGSGSGKTTLMNEVVREYDRQDKYTYLVVLSKDEPEQSPFAERCALVAELDDDAAAAGIDWRAALAQHRSLYIEVTALEYHDALDALGAALLELGSALIVVDEAQQIVDRNTKPGILQLYTRGRKYGISVISITQSIKQRSNWGLNAVAINEATALVTFLKTDPNEQKHILELIPELGDRLGTLKTPRDGAAEYAVKDLITGRVLLVARDGEHEIGATA